MNPTTVEFDASDVHAVLLPDGQPKVQRYDLQIFFIGAAAPFQTNNLGKPSPDGAGRIYVNLATVLAPWPLLGVSYESRVAAVGPTGITPSSPSNTFQFLPGSCTYSLSPTSQAIGSSAASGTLTVTTGAGCVWTAASDSGWLTMVTASGSGNSSVYYTVTANTGTTARIGTVMIGGQTYTVTQAAPAGALPCTYSLSPTTQPVGSSAASGTLTVNTAAGCAWTATSGSSWLTMVTASGSGNSSVYYTVTANTGTTARIGTVMIGGQTYTATQAAQAQAGTPCTFTLSPSSQSVAGTGASGTIALTAGTGCAWTATTSSDWLTVTNRSGSSSAGVNYTVTANMTGSIRAGTVTVGGQTFTVTQVAVPPPGLPRGLRIGPGD